jgi:hypothetical protein
MAPSAGASSEGDVVAQLRANLAQHGMVSQKVQQVPERGKEGQKQGREGDSDGGGGESSDWSTTEESMDDDDDTSECAVSVQQVIDKVQDIIENKTGEVHNGAGPAFACAHTHAHISVHTHVHIYMFENWSVQTCERKRMGCIVPLQRVTRTCANCNLSRFDACRNLCVVRRQPWE